MKIIVGLIGIILGFVIGLFSQDLFTSYFGGNKKDYELYKQLVEENNTAVALVDSNIEVTNLKLFDLYKFSYYFIVEDKVYGGSDYVNHEDSIPDKIVTINYLQSNPAINEVNVHDKLNDASSKIGDNGDLVWGIITGCFALLLFGYGVYNVQFFIRLQTRKGKIL